MGLQSLWRGPHPIPSWRLAWLLFLSLNLIAGAAGWGAADHTEESPSLTTGPLSFLLLSPPCWPQTRATKEKVLQGHIMVTPGRATGVSGPRGAEAAAPDCGVGGKGLLQLPPREALRIPAPSGPQGPRLCQGCDPGRVLCPL